MKQKGQALRARDILRKRTLRIVVCLPLLSLGQAPSAGADETASTPQQSLKNFRAGFYNGCIKGQKALGKPEKYQEAFCACMVTALGEVPEAELQAFAQRVQADPSAAPDPAFFEKLQTLGAADCPLVGQFDDTQTLSREEITRLGAPKVVENFSLRLPRGFLSLPAEAQGAVRTFAFARLHADLQRSTVIQVSIVDASQRPPGAGAIDRQQILSMFLDQLKAQRTEWTQSQPTEVVLGGLRFLGADWSGKADGLGREGAVYTAVSGSTLIALSTQDFRPFSSDTIPLAKEVFKTFELR